MSANIRALLVSRFGLFQCGSDRGRSALQTRLDSPHVQSSNAIMNVGGTYAPYIFAVGLFVAGFLALVVISLPGSWGVVEALNLKGNTWFKIYIAETLPAVVLVFCFN